MHSFLLVALAAISAQSPEAAAENPLQRIDYLRCVSNMERISSARLMSTPTTPNEMQAAMRCIDHHRQLELTKAQQLRRIYEAFLVQIESPSAVAHGELISASAAFMRGL